MSPDPRGAPEAEVDKPRLGSTPRPSSRPLTPPIFSSSSIDLGSTIMASTDGFSLKGVGSVVSFSGSSRLELNSPRFFFSFLLSFLFLPPLSDPSSTSVCSPVDLTFCKPRFSSSASPPAEDQVPTDHIRLCRTGSFSPITWRVSLPLSGPGWFSRKASDDR